MKKIIVIFIGILVVISGFSQDIIYKTDGTEIKAKVFEITTEAVKFKNYNQQEGPLRNISLTEVFMIIYEDGTKEVLKKQTATPPIEEKEYDQNVQIVPQEENQ